MRFLVAVAVFLLISLTSTVQANEHVSKAKVAEVSRPLPPPAPPPSPSPSGKLSVLETIKAGGKVTASQASNDPVGLLQGFLVSWVLPDVTAAKADADSQLPTPDKIGSMCWGAVIDFINSNPNLNPLPSGLGAAQLVQKARDIAAIAAQINSPTGPLAPLKIGCGPLVLDTNIQGANLLVKVGALIGVVIP